MPKLAERGLVGDPNTTTDQIAAPVREALDQHLAARRVSSFD